MDQAWHRFAAEAGEWLRIFVRTAEADTNTRKEQIAAYKMTCARRFIEKTRINACVSDLGIDGEQPGGAGVKGGKSTRRVGGGKPRCWR